MLRIIAGELKGRRLRSPDWAGLRPTSDRLRETLFNVLAPRIAGARVLDGFAGTGAIGIEALSRGAAHVTFVDRDPRALALVEENLRRCRVSDRYAIIRAAYGPAATRRLELAGFDLILLDPPYDGAGLDAIVAEGADLLAPDGLLVVEHARRGAAPASAGGLARVRQVASGDSMLSFYARQLPPGSG
jgi:16S rRNA (guanine(966)-N(2))-methyltransferase RsmD